MTAGYKCPESVLVVIYTTDLQVLLLERAKHPGYWQSVTGSREVGESFLATAVREVHEETGLSIKPGQLRVWPVQNRYTIMPEWRHRYAPGVTHNTAHVLSLCVPQALPVVLSAAEHRAWKWLAWQAAADACFSPSNAEAILLLPRFGRPKPTTRS